MNALKYFILFTFVIFQISCNEEPDNGQMPGANDVVLDILFIGNSHTFYNDLPNQVLSILESQLPDVEINISSSTIGGARFKDHTEAASTTNSITLKDWDWVVLQENAGWASEPKEIADVEVYPYARELRDRIRDNNSDTKILLYLTHAYQNGAEWCNENPNVCDYASMQNEIRRNYLFMENILDAKVAPAGIMWKILFSQNLVANLWDNDTIHPSPMGSAVSALTVALSISELEIADLLLNPALFDTNQQTLINNQMNNVLFDGTPDWRTF